MEESSTLNNMQIVPVSYENQKKARNELLKHKARVLAAKEEGKEVLFDIDQNEDTWITGGGIPGKKRKKNKKKFVEEVVPKEDRVYTCLEDELLDEVDQHQEDMKRMMAELMECDEMMAGTDLSHIHRMINATEQSLKQHT